MNMIDVITEGFCLDCGACGAPSCRALAEDIVRGDAKELIVSSNSGKGHIAHQLVK